MKLCLLFLCFLTLNLASAQVLKVCLESPVLEADLHKAQDTSSVEVFHKKIYESLIQFSKNKKGYYTLIAKNISFPTPKTIIIKLKENIKFHSNDFFKPKRTLNADDVIFSFQRQMSKYSGDAATKVFTNFKSRNLDDKILSISKKDSHTIIIKTKERIQNVYELLSEHFLTIYSYEYYQKLKKHKKLNYFTQYPIGTGPFTYTRNNNNKVFKFKTNSNYHGQVPRYEGLHFYIITDNQKRTQYTINGKCHITHNPSWDLLKEIEKSQDLKVESYQENNMLYLAINTQKKVFKNPEVRKAIALALNYELYMNKLFYGYAKRANHILTPNFKNYSSEFIQINQNLKQARKIIQKHFESPPKINLWTISVPRTYIPNGKKLAKLMKADLEKIGLKVSIKAPSFKDFLKKTGQGAHDLAIVGFANLTDQEEVLLSLSCNAIKAGTNRSMWCHKKFDQLINMYLNTRTKQTKNAYLKQASLLFNKYKPRIPIAYMGKKKVISKSILNFNSSDDSAGDYSDIIFLNSILGNKQKENKKRKPHI